ncbi:MAG: hypothetical protein A3I89_00615 [Candidatus Harrisonbacteria bacterium RIFCSPLOWO2_02_FULL_41_11]|uniref:Uncharacterized protein n=1 Tax=Candidatus Harrisonbacteria bacterium RIFCSPHIGHO2_02_FULL_42_16 TaxID=1798404 RepID=A0A1G1ZIK8_9BACT|nr:MAG: hypothetical protein A3B92_02420 [Candidatus Harrisonbacteria bacterium RIFCSPHIGHO2_02_FULL_42_16]OGY66498.1 MAG: hypothetical protein A3I89_00615 [Candidatus Harrisonbacteria bacterium RIFCSPLOWO2_02_FULL_41_11]
MNTQADSIPDMKNDWKLTEEKPLIFMPKDGLDKDKEFEAGTKCFYQNPLAPEETGESFGVFNREPQAKTWLLKDKIRRSALLLNSGWVAGADGASIRFHAEPEKDILKEVEIRLAKKREDVQLSNGMSGIYWQISIKK